MGDFRSKKKSDETMQNRIDAIEDEYDIGKGVKPSNLPPIKPPEVADPERATLPIPDPSAEDAETMEIVRKRWRDTEIKPYVEDTFDVNDDPRLKSIQSMIDMITSQISSAESNMPSGGAYFIDEFLGSALGETEHTTQYTLDEQRRDHAKARIQDLYAKKADLEMQYQSQQQIISNAHGIEHSRKADEHYQKEFARIAKESNRKPSAFCENCGKSLKPTAKFCGGCGTQRS